MKKKKTLAKRQSMYGICFMIPWCIGFVLFFLIPIIQSITFSFSKVQVETGGFKTIFVALENFDYIFNVQPDYTGNLTTSLTSFIYSLPIITVLSLLLALLLNQKFKGRLVARAVFFIPAIITSGVVMSTLMQGDATTMVQGGSSAYFTGGIDYNKVLTSMGLPNIVTDTLAGYIAEISTLIWNCSVPTILFLSGLQAIPDQLYEVSKVEGATAWEAFWFITFPQLANILVVSVAYISIDLLTNADNAVMTQVYNLAFNQQNYDTSSAMLWAYFPIIGLIVGLLIGIISYFSRKRWDS